MQTNFTKKQLQDSNISSADGILRKCVHCGFCNATCPTYQIVGDELDGPRGRIYLIKDMLENDKPANEKIAKHIDRCLSCYACMTTCPSGVNYMHLVDHARNHIEKTFVRPFFDRFIRNLLSKILPSPTLFRMAGYSARLFYPFRFLFPKKIKNMMKYMPNSFPVSRQENKEIYSSVGKTYARVALLTGCVQRVISPQINDATIDILNRHGVEVIVPKKVDCCGSLNHHLGKEELAHKSFINNINSWFKWYEEKNLDAILVTTSGCGTTLKDYGYIFRDHPDKELRRKAKMVSSLAKDVTEYLGKNIKLNYVKKDKKFTIAYHSACSMQHGQKIHSQPMDLLKKTGNEIVEIPDGHLCCGSAGTYNLLQDEMAAELLKRKVSNIDKVKPDFISTGNIGCMTQISSGTKIPIVHTIEILNWYTGGEKPIAINLL
ncbi:MAG: glycolate oxidase subunit GlcF [Candidatus Fonsibacter sp.]|jgi:glycolate oxidase iron-sulfur subunit|nr:glycolate oxidase subunit GlcF [Candidatus Fonsibacter sp.]